MDRIIEVKVNGSHLTKDNKNAGVQHEANSTVLRIEFDPGWDGYAKKITWWDAKGKNPVERTLTADLLEDLESSIRVYLAPIPGEALLEAGECTFVIDGYIDGTRRRSLADRLTVRPAPFVENADEPIDPTPTQAEQLQAQIDTLLGDIQEQAVIARDAADEAREDAEKVEQAVINGPYISDNNCWMLWDFDGGKYINSNVKATGPRGPAGPQGPTGPQGPQGMHGVVLSVEPGQYAFEVDVNGHLILVYSEGSAPPDFELGDDGHLYLNLT